MKDAEFEQFRNTLLMLARSLLARQRRADIEASDLVQESMLEAHRDRHKCTANTDAEKFAWLRQILQNNFLDAYNKAHAGKRDVARKALEADLSGSFAGLDALLVASQTSPSEGANRNEQLTQLADALEQLPEQQRTVIMLKDLNGLTLKEVSDELDMTIPVVAGHLYRGRQRLMELMKAD